jgi:hypothetical protein
MTPPNKLICTVAAAAGALALALPGAAGATTNAKPGDRTFQETYPAATRVCARVAAGTENKHLKQFATQVTADCTTLQNAFNASQTTVLAARTAILPVLAADRAAVHAACPGSKVNPTVAACVKAHKSLDAQIKSLSASLHAAYRAYGSAVEAARVAFWTAFKSLPGEKHAKTDLPVPAPH